MTLFNHVFLIILIMLSSAQVTPLKQAVLDIFSDGKGLVNVEHLVLYACASSKGSEGVENAVKTLGNADGSVGKETLQTILSLASLSCFDAAAAAADAELVDAAIAAVMATEGREEGAKIFVKDLIDTDKGLAFVSACQGLEAKAPYAMLAKL